jgi:hypothetical protein
MTVKITPAIPTKARNMVEPGDTQSNPVGPGFLLTSTTHVCCALHGGMFCCEVTLGAIGDGFRVLWAPLWDKSKASIISVSNRGMAGGLYPGGPYKESGGAPGPPTMQRRAISFPRGVVFDRLLDFRIHVDKFIDRTLGQRYRIEGGYVSAKQAA